MTLKVIDLFCGGGGLSVGLHHAGFEVILGIDNDKWAVETFKANHRGAEALKLDLRNFDPRSLPHCDILVGGPPCVEFSTSKPEANRNVISGLLLVQSFLRAVYYLKPKYWIMENVPRLSKYLPAKIPYQWFGVDEPGYLEVPEKNFFLAADFGAPQSRKRYLVGRYPIPDPTHRCVENAPASKRNSTLPNWRTFGEALNSLPSPYKQSKNCLSKDFNYGFELPEEMLTDHYYDARLSKRDLRGIKKVKTAHPYMGFLPFPDVLSRPARTVVATQLGRETIVIEDKIGSKRVMRRLTVRECAVLQTFPTTFQFFGNSYSKKYSLVGNAVPPVLSFAIGNKIRQSEGVSILRHPIVETKISIFSKDLGDTFISVKRKRRINWDRKFAELVPGKEMRGCRAELSNRGKTQTPSQINGNCSRVRWVAMFFVGEGRNMKSTEVSMRSSLEEFISGCPYLIPTETAIEFLERLSSELGELVRDADTLQKSWALETDDAHCIPLELIEKAASIVDDVLPKKRFEKTRLAPTGSLKIAPRIGTRVRIVAGLVAASFIANSANKYKVPISLSVTRESEEGASHKVVEQFILRLTAAKVVNCTPRVFPAPCSQEKH